MEDAPLVTDGEFRARLLSVADSYAAAGGGYATEVRVVGSDRRTANELIIWAGVDDDRLVWVLAARGTFHLPRRRPPGPRQPEHNALPPTQSAFLLVLDRADLQVWDWGGGPGHGDLALLGTPVTLRAETL